MIKVELPWVAEVVHGQLISPTTKSSAALSTERVTIDSRAVQPGDLFIAIEGPRFDGHDYAEQAVRDGAVAIITQRRMNVDVPQILVQDTRYALGLLAAAVKKQTKVKTIAMTGSSGKTTVKEMCASILRESGAVLATQGNFNNDIGVPLTLLNLTHDHDFAVIELGANHRGEIAYTTQL
ncbi:MAG: UDP-N-acetylmuramoyl-tripeptide--D-alanyl-D-alanine ligase, partial [Idiomarina sp.]|nr:UDP-N-acetylmuramoyl-tripeptide--D-alanyl-D-alanine ligase [Idiomarina sp.]